MKLFFSVVSVLITFAVQGLAPAKAFALNAQLPSEPCGITYTIEPRDTLSTIAEDCDTTVESILELNPEITNPNLIFVGQKLQISGSVSAIDDYPTAYTVLPGETLEEIARLFGLSVWTIRRFNPHVWYNNPIYPGLVLYIPSTSAYAEYPRVSLDLTTASADDDVLVYVRGFPPNSRIDYRIGIKDGEIFDIYDGFVDAQGTASEIFTIPYIAEEGEEWVIQVVTTSVAEGVEVTSHSIYIDN